MMWNKLAIAATLCGRRRRSAAYAQQSATTGAATPVQAQVLSSLPANSTTVTNYYKQNVYDPSDAKIGEISDVLVNKEGQGRSVHRFGRRFPRHRPEGRRGAVLRGSRHGEERHLVSHHERHQGFAQAGARLHLRQGEGHVGAGGVSPDTAVSVRCNRGPCRNSAGAFRYLLRERRKASVSAHNHDR